VNAREKDLRNVLVKIAEAAYDGLGPSFSGEYAFDRLRVIQKLASAGIVKLDRPKPARMVK